MIDNRTVGRTIATLRQAKGMTQQQLAAAMNVSHQAVSKWENGAALPDIQTLVGLTQLFGITVEQLLSGEIPEARLEEETAPSFEDHLHNIGNFVGNVIDDIGKNVENLFRVNAEELADAEEPVEKPEDEAIADEKEENIAKSIDLKELLEMAPFMSKAAVSEMLAKSKQKLTPAEIARFAPFVDAACLERLICECESEMSWDSLRRLAPFLKKEMVDAFARAIAMGEKYVRPMSNEVNRVAEDVWKNLDDVSRKIEKGVDKAVRKVVKLGENVVNEVSKAFDDLTSEAETRDERRARIRRSAFEKAVEDGRWDWIAAHIREVRDEDLRRKISEAANRQGMQDWVFENLGGYADPETIDKAVSDGDWSWLGEHIEGFDAGTQRRIARAAADAENWDWLSACAEQIQLGDEAVEIAAAARRAGAKMLAVQLLRYDMQRGQIEALAFESAEEGDVEFISMIDDVLTREEILECCVRMAKSCGWDGVFVMAEKLDAENMERLMETAIQMGDFDAVDRIDDMLNAEEEDQK